MLLLLTFSFALILGTWSRSSGGGVPFRHRPRVFRAPRKYSACRSCTTCSSS